MLEDCSKTVRRLLDRFARESRGNFPSKPALDLKLRLPQGHSSVF